MSFFHCFTDGYTSTQDIDDTRQFRHWNRGIFILISWCKIYYNVQNATLTHCCTNFLSSRKRHWFVGSWHLTVSFHTKSCSFSSFMAHGSLFKEKWIRSLFSHEFTDLIYCHLFIHFFIYFIHYTYKTVTTVWETQWAF